MNTIKEQIKIDITRYMGRADVAARELCQIVDDNFEKPDEIQSNPFRDVERYQATQEFFKDTSCN